MEDNFLPTFYRWPAFTIKHKNRCDRGLEEAAELEKEGAEFGVFPLLRMEALAVDSRRAVVQPDAGIKIKWISESLGKLLHGSPCINADDKAVQAAVVT